MTPRIKWLNPGKVFGKAMLCMFRPEDMLKDFVKHDLLEEITDDYSADVFMMCKNGAMWLGAKLEHAGFDDVKIINGTFLGDQHCWVSLGNLYVDLTIAQSDPSYPKLAVCYADGVQGYEELTKHSVLQFANNALHN
jgi:hypothetical protein